MSEARGVGAFSLIPLGVGDAFTARYYTSCIVIQASGSRLLIDCPHPIRKILREGGAIAGVDLDLDSIDAVVLTHLHADHSSGLEGYGYFSFFALQRKARLAVHADVAKRLWPGHLAAGMECLMNSTDFVHREKTFDDYFELLPLSEDRPLELGPFAVECRKTIHHIPTTALRIRAEGRTLGISSDTAFDPDLIQWLAEADLIVHETNYGVHTPYEKLVALPAELRAKMRLIHYPDEFDVESSEIEALQQGRLYLV